MIERDISLLFATLVLLISGCAGYPLHMTEMEWNALTPEQQAEARKRQKEAFRYEADARLCHHGAERKVTVRIPTAGLQGNPQGRYEISLGENWEFYRHCMELAGWDITVERLAK